MPLEAVENQEAGPIPADQITTPVLPAAPDRQMQLNPEWLIAKAIEQKLPVRSLEQLLAMRERLKAERAREAFYRALSAFQAACPVIPKNKTATVASRRTGASYKYHYATLDDIIRVVGQHLLEHGLSYRIDTRVEGNPPFLVATCTVHHREGHVEASEFRVPIEMSGRMNPAQEYGSAGTYSKRYAFCNAFGILTGDEDDDGQSLNPPVAAGGGIAEERLLGVLKGYIDEKTNARQLKNWGERYAALVGLLSEEGKVKIRQHYAARYERLNGKRKPSPPFLEVLRLAKLAKADDEREVVRGLAQGFPEAERCEIERVLG